MTLTPPSLSTLRTAVFGSRYIHHPLAPAVNGVHSLGAGVGPPFASLCVAGTVATRITALSHGVRRPPWCSLVPIAVVPFAFFVGQTGDVVNLTVCAGGDTIGSHKNGICRNPPALRSVMAAMRRPDFLCAGEHLHAKSERL